MLDYLSLICRTVRRQASGMRPVPKQKAATKATVNAGIIIAAGLLIFGGLLGSIQTASAQLGNIRSAADVVTWTASLSPSVIGPGDTTLLVVDIELDGDWKVYALDSSLPQKVIGVPRPFGVEMEWPSLPEGVYHVEPIRQIKPEESLDEQFNMVLKFFHKRARFVAPFKADADAPDGLDSLVADVRFQICSDGFGICLNPTTTTVFANLRVNAACTSPECSATDETMNSLLADDRFIQDTFSGSGAALSAGSVSTTSDFNQYRAGGLFSFLLLAIGAGLASLLTPCVFPMIPLTVSYFTKHAHDRAAATKMATLFGGSIIVTFTTVGIVAAMVIGAAGAQRIASNPWVNLFIAIVLVGFALSLLGLYEIRLPNNLLNYFDRKGKEGKGIVGTIFMGLTLTLVSFSCTAPFVGGLLAAASGGTWLYPLLGMVVYSTTFALPFVFFALFPNALASLPRSGSWMNVSIVVLGFIELAAAVKFLSNSDLIWQWGLISRPLGIAFVIVIFFLTGLYLLGKLPLNNEPRLESLGAGRMMSASFFFMMALYMMPGLLGAPLNKLDAYLPPRNASDVSLLSGFSFATNSGGNVFEADWFTDDIDGAFAEALIVKKPVLIDFTGYTCTNCREMEANVFIRPPIAQRFERDFVLLRLYTDGIELGDEFNRYQLNLTGTVALPTYAIVDPSGQQLISRTSGMMDLEEFASFLDAGFSSYVNTERLVAVVEL